MRAQKGQMKMKRTRQTKVRVVADEKEPNEEGQPSACVASKFACKHAARKMKEGGGAREEKEKEGEKEAGVPSYDTSVQGHTKKEGLPAMTKHPGTPKEEGEERKERRKERERERKGEERKGKGRCSQLRTVVQGHTTERKG